MKNWLLHSITMGALLFLAASCSSEEAIEVTDPTTTSEEVHVTFTLAMGSASAGSRAETWESNEATSQEIGDNYDNQINPNSLQVLIFDANGNYLAEVENLLYYQTDQIDIYAFEGECTLQNVTAAATYKLMVFANCPDVTDANYSTLTFNTNNQGIPMWGVKTALLDLTPGTRTELTEHIYVLRATAKVKFNVSTNLQDKGYKITAASANTYNTSGYCLPTGYASVADTEDLDTETVLNPLATTPTGTIEFDVADDGLSALAYLPEYDASAESANMSVTLQKGDDTTTAKTFTIDFKTYADGKATTTDLDIVRNHLYTYSLDMKEESTLSLIYDVVAITPETITVPTFK